MDMGMIVKSSCVGMENGGKSRLPAKSFVVSGEFFQGSTDTGEHQRIDGFLISPGKIPELFGQGKSDQEIRGRQSLVQLLFDPLAALMILAMGAVPVAAGMWNIGLCSTRMVRTLRQHMWAMILPAPGNDP
jgi:hypothetical protein